MAYWLFKLSDHPIYPEAIGKTYVYDNRHSKRVRGGDEFIYLDKREGGYSFLGAGAIHRVKERRTEAIEDSDTKANTIYTAELMDFVLFVPPVDISSTRKGKRNRHMLGLPDNLNDAGYSRSMVSITSELFDKLLDSGVPPPKGEDVPTPTDWRIEDSWSKVKKRLKVAAFRAAVLERHHFTCAACGTQLRCTLTAAHIRPWTADPDNRANPANGICLCVYCHRAFDCGLIHLEIEGTLTLAGPLDEAVATAHFRPVPASIRKPWMSGVDPKFLEGRKKS